MKARVRDLVKYGEACGFELVGLGGSGHYKLRHTNGALIVLASSPGDGRGDLNQKSKMRRLSGVNPDQTKRRKAGRA